MPTLKTRALFISHAWKYNQDYWTVVEWLNNASNFYWRNCSIPSHDGLVDTSIRGLKEGITRQIRPAQGVIIIAGMYTAYSDWIDYEINEAIRMNKTLIGVRPRGQQRVPRKVQDNCIMINWNSASLINMIRALI